MMLLTRFQTIREEDKQAAVTSLIERATPDFDFSLMIVLAVLMATFGLIADSETIVVGSMLMAPILYPMMVVALGISMSDALLIGRSLTTVIKSAALAIATSALAAFLYAATHGGAPAAPAPIILMSTAPSLIYTLVAIVSGVAVAYTLMRPKLSEILPGVAISLSLIPPLAVTGIGIAWLDPYMAGGALAMFGVNIAGVVVAGSICFSLMNVHGERRLAESAIAKEDKRVEKENLEIKRADEALRKEPAGMAK